MTRRWINYWWTRPAGARAVLVLALPLIVSTASWTVMNFVDRMFLLWHSTAAMSATMPAGMLHFAVLCFPLGMASYVNTFVAQYCGAGRPDRIGLAVWHGVWLALLFAPLFLLTIPLAPLVFHSVGHDPEIARLEVLYYQVLAFGGGATVLAAALSSFFTGRGETRVVMLVDCVAAVVNVVLDYAWIFGHWGFPAGGIVGAAWGTVVAQWSRPLMYASIMALPRYRATYQLAAGCRFDPALWRRLVRYGGPNGLQFLVEISAVTLFILLVGSLGREATAATTLAFNVNSIAFVPMIGLGIAVSTAVGHQLGRNRPRLASRATWTSFLIAASYMGSLALLYVVVPDWFLAGFAYGATAGDFGRLRDLTVVLLRFVAAYSLFDAMNLIFVSAIKGAGDTRFVLLVNAIMSPLPLIAGWWGIKHLGLGLLWCWVVITAWVCTLGIVFWLRFLQGHWRTMRVIEPEPAADGPEPAARPGPADGG
jgi:MATE family multidrug resistance protein